VGLLWAGTCGDRPGRSAAWQLAARTPARWPSHCSTLAGAHL